MGAVQHGRRPASSSEPPGRPTPPVDAHGGGEHDGDDRATRDLAVGEFTTGQTTSLRCASDRWGHANRGARASVPLGALHWVHVALTDFDIFYK